MLTATESALNENEKALMAHVGRWGLDGYPVQKMGRHWYWREAFGVKCSPVAYKTKREAVAVFETWMDLKREQLGAEAQARALAELAARSAA